MANQKRLGSTDVMMLLAILFWGVNLTVIKIAMRHLSPHAFNSVRLAGSALILFLILALRRESLSVSGRDLLLVAVLGILGNFCYQVLFIRGFDLTSASNASLILATSPIFIALIGSLFKMERLTWVGWLGIVVSFAGLYLVVSRQAGGFRFQGSGLKGDLLIFAGNIFWAAYTVFSKPILDRMSPLKFSTLTLAAGAVVYLVYAAPELGRLDWSAVPAPSWVALAGSGLFAIVLGYIFWYSSVKAVGSAKTAVFNNVTPVLAILFAVIFLGERFQPAQILGGLVILAGVYMTRTGDLFFIKNRVVSHLPE